MDNLLVEVRNGEVITSSRNIAASFGKRHDHVLRDIEGIRTQNWGVTKMFFESRYAAGTGKQYKEYLMNRDGFSLLVMGFTGKEALDWKLKYIAAFNAMEKELHERKGKGCFIDFNDPIASAEAWIASQKEKQLPQNQIEADKPKVAFADSVAASHTTILIGELAKLLHQNGTDMGQKRLFQKLRDDGFLIRRKGTDYNMPTQRAMEMGLFRIKETSISHSDGHISVSKTPKVTGKGQQYFVNRYKAVKPNVPECKTVC